MNADQPVSIKHVKYDKIIIKNNWLKLITTLLYRCFDVIGVNLRSSAVNVVLDFDMEPDRS